MRLLPASLTLAAAGLSTAAAVWGPLPRHAGPPPPVLHEIAETGSVSGRVTFAATRPRQPIIIYLERQGGELDAPRPAALVIRQKGASFTPSFAVLVAGQEVVFENDEDRDIDHNVYTLGSEERDFGIFSPGKSVRHTFSEPGEFSLYCSIHKLMDGKLFVAPSRAWSEVAQDGTFAIRDIPPGSYTLKTYQKARRFRDAAQPVAVSAGKESTVTVELAR
ncbi:MAG: hypothetical protein HUU15_04930 [Candidatus Brocadiae bacterium]|nr:hypothetical protein [Candidatus Brocadiia bacterium]